MEPAPRYSSSATRRRKEEGGTFSPYKSRSREDMSSYQARAGMATIRTVTPDNERELRYPESIPEGQPVSTSDFHERFVGDRQVPNSPPGGSNGTLRSSRMRAGTQASNERTQLGSMRDQALPASTRPRTRTLEETRSLRDQSPSGALAYERGGGATRPRHHRMGSVHSVNSATFREAAREREEDAQITSIGHPAIIPANLAYHLSIRNANADQTRRPLTTSRPSYREDEYEQPASSSATPQPRSQRERVPPTDTRKMLQLMKSTRGRMEGPLAFRRVETVPWSLSYCSINDESGSLVYEPKNGGTDYKTLIPDVRGCNIKPAWDAESHMPYLDVCPQNSKLKVHLRPHSQEEFDSWFAALLCWQPMRPKGMQNRMTKSAEIEKGARQLIDTRRHSEVSLNNGRKGKEAPVIKVGKMIFWDTNVSYSYTGTPRSKGAADEKTKPPTSRMQSFGSRRWRRVSCTLRESGELKLFSEQDQTLVSCVQLSQLSRCAVQRLDPSVLDNDFCIAIYPQYSISQPSQGHLRAIYVSLESRVLYEVWLVLLRAFTIPQLYGPKQPNASPGEQEMTPNRRHSVSTTTGLTTQDPLKDMFRMERSLTVRVVDARIAPSTTPQSSDSHDRPRSGKSATNSEIGGGYYAEVLLDGETRAKTMVKNTQQGPLWREEFEFLDLPAVLSIASILLKKRPPSPPQDERSSQKEMKRIHDALNSSDSIGGQSGISFDAHVGKVDLYLDDLEPGKSVEKWWPLLDHFGTQTGEVLINITVEESVILIAKDYRQLSAVLHDFSNGLTLQIAQMVPSELKKVSECMLNIFQVSGKASEWIMSLVEEEIDGITRNTPALRHRFARRQGSNDSGEGTTFGPPMDRELMVRDMGKSATLEANLLFRGNTLLTKSLDFHMKRLGKEWLEATLGDKVKEIADRDPDCEVDPSRVANYNDLDRNWRKMIGWTSEVWKCVYQSVSTCPAELRYIFRHIRACAEERYGDFLKSVRYSSVSGFLFLRFFCPAILNPKLFGLLKDHPKANARRTFTLIAKSIQTLANMASFGQKEQWMEPMNTFLASHRAEFKSFLDNICAISTVNKSSASPIPPSYSTPLAILTRLPPTSREGFPSLPYLIDHAKNFAALVNLWLDHANQQGHIAEEDGDLLSFHRTCQDLRRRTEDCLAGAERAERPGSTLSSRWEEVVEGLESSNAQAKQARSLHSRVGSSTSTTHSQPDSPIESKQMRDLGFTDDPVIRTKSAAGRRQNSHSSVVSSAPSQHFVGTTVEDDSNTPPQSSHEDGIFGSYTIQGASASRGIYPYSAGSLSNSDISKAKDRHPSRDIPMSQIAAPRRDDARTPVRGVSASTMQSNLRHETNNLSPDERAERSWLGDMPDEHRETQIQAGSWTTEQERTWAAAGDVLVRASTSNGRPTRNANKRHALLQQQAEEMEPGEPKDWKTRASRSNGATGPAPERLPRRDWAVPTDEKGRRLVIDMAAERAAAMRAGSLVSCPTSTEGPNIQNVFDNAGLTSRTHLPVQYNTYPPGSSHSSYPTSRRESRQGSMISMGGMGSDGEEGTTALPRMQYKSAAAAVGAEIGLLDSFSSQGSTMGSAEGMGAGVAKKKKEAGSEKSVFDRIGFSKKKKPTS